MLGVFGLGRAGTAITTGIDNVFLGRDAGEFATTGSGNTFLGNLSGVVMTTGSKNTILGRYSGNSSGLDIRTSSNYIVLSDGDGNPRGVFDNSGNFLVGTTSTVDSNCTAIHSKAVASTKWVQAMSGVDRGMVAYTTATSGSVLFHYFIYNGSNVGSISSTGP